MATMTIHNSHLLITAPGTPCGAWPAGTPASRDGLAGDGTEGFVLDQALVELSGSGLLSPVPIGPRWEEGPGGQLIPFASVETARHASPLRCFTIPFWRRALPGLTPVLVVSPLAEAERALVAEHDISPEHARQLWLTSVLAALYDLAGAPVAVTRPGIAGDLDYELDGTAGAPATQIWDLLKAESVDALVAALIGSHDPLPIVVDRLSLLEATVELSRWRVREDLVVSTFQVYWAAEGDDFDEERSATLDIALGRSVQVLTAILPREPIDAIRVDPIATPCVLAINQVRVIVGGEVVTTIPGGSGLFAAAAVSGIVRHPANPDQLVCVSEDSNLNFDVRVRPKPGDEVKVAISLSARPISPLDRPALYAELASIRAREDGGDDSGTAASPSVAPKPPKPAGTAPQGPRAVQSEARKHEGATASGPSGAGIPDLSQWEAHGFIPGGDWCIPDHYDPKYLSPALDGPPPAALELRMAVDSDSIVTTQLFVAKSDGLFDERSAIRILLASDRQAHTYRIDLPEALGRVNRRDIRWLRLDPVNQVVPFSVERIGALGEGPTDGKEDPKPTPLHLPDETRRTVLSISHSDYLGAVGGIEKRLGEEQIASTSQGLSYLHLSPVVHTWTFGDNEDLLVHVRLNNISRGSREIDDVIALVSRLPIAAVVLHHAMGWTGPSLSGVLRSTTAPVFYHTHDYFTICPQYTLMRNDRQYCGAPAPDSASCRICVSGKARQAVGPRLKRLLTDLGERLTIVCPSETAARLHRQALPELAHAIQVIPHDDIALVARPEPRSAGKRLRLAFIGAPQRNKGWPAWRRLCDDIGLANHYELFHLGLDGTHTVDHHVPVSFLVDGPGAMTAALEATKIDVALVWSEWPETYSFTTLEAITAGCLVITSSTSGNAAELVRFHDAGLIAESESELILMLKNDSRLRQLADAQGRRGWTSHPRFKIINAVATGAPHGP